MCSMNLAPLSVIIGVGEGIAVSEQRLTAAGMDKHNVILRAVFPLALHQRAAAFLAGLISELALIGRIVVAIY